MEGVLRKRRIMTNFFQKIDVIKFKKICCLNHENAPWFYYIEALTGVQYLLKAGLSMENAVFDLNVEGKKRIYCHLHSGNAHIRASEAEEYPVIGVRTYSDNTRINGKGDQMYLLYEFVKLLNFRMIPITDFF
eukprot:TRINITY_DN1054_c0_g1_i3.p2 TRINITY_DN1054_c0_g1~~TRINITY_DN1054_c0_g1_i3.p2  ORF type:complete len:133 (+),score=13.89 TRINITY_DN1054_c0_g1_i3:247-645(+)